MVQSLVIKSIFYLIDLKSFNRDKKYFNAAPIEKNSLACEAAESSSEIQKEMFRGPRDALLTLCGIFTTKGGNRHKELTKLTANIEHVRIPDLIDPKCHVV